MSQSVDVARRWTLYILLFLFALELAATSLLIAGVEISQTATIIVGFLFAGGLVYFAVLFLRSLIRKRLQFRLSTLLLLTMVAGAACGIVGSYIHDMRAQAAAVRGLEQRNCYINFSEPPFRSLLENLHIVPWFKRVSLVSLESPPDTTDTRVQKVSEQLRLLPCDFQLSLFSDSTLTDDGLRGLGKLSHLVGLRLGGVTEVSGKTLVPVSPQITDAALEHLSSLRLIGLDVPGTSVTCEGLAKLSNPASMRGLVLEYSHVTDTRSEVFENFENLELLSLQGNRISDHALVHIAKLRKLKTLLLNMTDVTDAGLVHLKALKNLTTLGLGGLSVSESAVRDLQSALPKCRIFSRYENTPSN